MSGIQQTISDYLDYEDRQDRECDRRNLSAFTKRCFVGMVESGEATFDDFDAVMPGLAAVVLATKESYQRKADQISKGTSHEQPRR
jgi:hypothetical protein